VQLPEGDYSTVGGLVMALLGHIPRPGDRVEVDGAAVEVSVMRGRTVAEVVVEETADDGHEGVRE
jgi:putative hemolysin